MRIEFISEAESLEGLLLIRQVIDMAIEVRKVQLAEFAARVKAPELPNIPKIPTPPPTPPAPIVDENTGEVVRQDGTAAAAAFGKPANPSTPPLASNAGAAGSSNAGTSATANTSESSSTGASAPPNAGSVDRDSKGIPWDARIHSEAKTKNNDGTWRYKRKLDEATKALVLAEITPANGSAPPAANGVSAATGVPPLPPPPPPVTLPPATDSQPAVPLPPPNAGVPDAPVAPVVPTPPVNPTAAAPAPSSATAASSAAGGASRIDFRTLIIKLNKAISAGTVTQDALTLACRELGLGESPAALGKPENAHLCDSLDALLFPVAS